MGAPTQTSARTDPSVVDLRDSVTNRQSTHTVFVRDYVTKARIGVYESEQGQKQDIRINLDLTVTDPADPLADEYGQVVCYDALIAQVEDLLQEGHIGLVETLAERIAALALENSRVLSIRVRIEKLEAIQAAASVGVLVERAQRA